MSWGHRLRSWARPSAVLLVCLLASGSTLGQDSVCTGSFPNLITDICYDCMFPIHFAGGLLNLGVSGDDYDTGASSLPVCVCINTLSVGTPIGFWEPRYMVDTTNVPGCMPLLGGISISPPYNAMEFGGAFTTNGHIGGTSRGAFMQANEYINPVMSALGVISSSPCLDNLCTPIGRPLQFQEIGAARPQDKDYGYFVFQRKDCCAAYTVVGQ